jgi:type IV secretion system protein VirB10
MATVPPGDPRVAANGGEANVAPTVALPRGGPSWIVIAIGMAIFGVLLFSVLDSRRRATEVPSVRPGASDRLAGGTSAAPPSLYVPPVPQPEPPQQIVTVQPEPVRQAPPPPQPQIIYVPQPAPPQPQQQVEPVQQQRASSAPTLVYDGTEAPSTGAAPPGPGAAQGATDGATGGATPSVAGNRARAGTLANRSTTVPQGTLIPAVLETGLDSTKPGLARAMVTRDVRGFDGTRILIPRGSRLIGEYQSTAATGQKRAMVNWIRLIRPDGVTIAIGSPASDPLGRGGIGARVINHFFARFAGAILQSTLDIGVNLASRSAGAPVIVALPGTVQNVTQPLQQNQQITPTLTVRPGTSITIFVARDLDFSGSGGRR